jgi:hypothetical protein
MRLLALNVKDRGDGLEVSVAFTYEGKLPDKRRRREFAADALRRALGALEKDEAVEVGFAEDGKRRLRREQWILDKEAS